MRISNKNHELIHHNEQIVKKPLKHDANLQKNSTLYFQVGLIVCLLAAYGLFEMKFESYLQPYANSAPLDEPYSIEIPIIKPEQPTFEVPVDKKRRKQPTDFILVPDNTLENLFKMDIKQPTIVVGPPADPRSINVIAPPDDVFLDFVRIQQVPIYPGCESEKTNDDKRKCMSEKITKLIQRKFDTDLGVELGLLGKQVIRTRFRINKTGHVTNIEVFGTHPKLEEEAKRVINKIPEMIPGKQHDKNVGVIYSLPIVFQVHN